MFSNLNLFRLNIRPFWSQRCHFESIASTIFALSTNIKNTGSAIAVIRVSGPQTLHVIDKVTNGRGHLYEKNPRKAILQKYYDPSTLEVIDNGILLWFPSPKSYTGDDMAELQVHGSMAVIARLLAVLGQFKGCRLAAKGEFTKRALTNGKLQLIQAEGIKDLVHAQTEAQRKRALSVMSGSLEAKFDSWRKQIVKLMAHLEAYIDFSEDELIDPNVVRNLNCDIAKLITEIDRYLKKSKKKSDLIKDGYRIAIVGEANVGKSSIINKLCEKDLSIVSPISGTTRDIVETWININGNSVCIADTAGIKNLSDESIDVIEREGIRKAIERAKQCNMIILVIDASKTANPNLIPDYIKEILDDRHGDLLTVVNKIDLLTMEQLQSVQRDFQGRKLISCKNNKGFSEFFDELCEKIDNSCDNSDPETLFSNERHLVHLSETIDELNKVNVDKDFAIAAMHLRQAAYHLGCLTGNITTEDVLDVLFKDFCIGK